MLETERLLFRNHEPGDEPGFIAMQTDAEVRRWVGGSPWPREKAIYRFRTQYLGKPAGEYGLRATVLKAEGRYIGHCGLTQPKGKKAKLAYHLARPYWGRGLATEACRALIRHAFEKLHLTALAADVEVGNAASEHILRKLGFELVDREEIPGRVFHVYRLTAPDTGVISSAG